MSLISLFGGNTEEVSLVIDIGNGSVAGSFVLYTKDAKPTILYTTRSLFPVNTKPSAEKLLGSTIALLETVLTDVTRYGFLEPYFKTHRKSISKVCVSVTSPWFVSKTKQLLIKQDTPFVITQKFLDSILLAEEQAFVDDLEQSNYNDLFGHKLRLIEQSIVHTKINGYEMSEIVGKKTKEFEASLYFSIMSSDVLKSIEETIIKHTHISKDDLFFHTFPLITFSVLRDIFPLQKDCIIIDVTSEVTDITLVIDDVLQKTTSFPCGRNFILRQISKVCNVSPEIAESTLRLFVNEKSDENVSLQIRTVLDNIEKEWAIYFESAMFELSPESVFPPKVFLTADADTAPLIVNFLKIPKTDATAEIRKKMQVTHIHNQLLDSLYQADSNIFVDEFTTLIALFFDRVYKSK